ncbi:hypothetical protein F5877DRAFT_22859, partial [Lentinula edodes]
YYAQFEAIVGQVHAEPTDPFLLQLLGEDLNQFSQLAQEHATIFEPEEAQILQSSIQVMILDIRALYERCIELSHNGRPEVVFTEYTGRPGRPRTVINPDFLRFAHNHCTTTGLSHFLDVPRPTVRRRLLECGIATPGIGPFNFPPRGIHELQSSESDDVLDITSNHCDTGLICWGIVIHGFIDGYSRLITGLRASNNNRGQTVLSLFLSA